MPQQVKLCRWAKRRRAIPVWMSMRLGKTLAAKRWAQTRPGARHTLVVAPLAALPGWRRELLADGEPEHSIADLSTSRSGDRLEAVERAADEGARWFLVNPRKLTVTGQRTRGGKPKAVPSRLSLVPWDAVLFDESTTIRSPRAQVTRVAIDWLSRATYCACLSGLPNPESSQDFVTQMLFLFGEFMGHRSFWTWRQEFMRASDCGGWEVEWKARGAIRAEVRRLSFVMSKSEAGIGSRLMRETRYVSLPARVAREIRSAQRDMEIGDQLTNCVLESMTWQAQLAGGRFPHDPALHHDRKLRELVYLATGELSQEPLVVAARFTAELVAARDALERAGVSTVLVHGGARGDLGLFRSGEARALVCQPKVLQMGVDLSTSSTMICLSRWWDHEVNAQFEERTEHPSKKEPRLVVDIVAQDTIDEDVVEALSDKESEARSFTREFLGKIRERAKGARSE
jgi:hypothetical protein